jgi:pimeloyl-ACP methyl ester carboxylesterase
MLAFLSWHEIAAIFGALAAALAVVYGLVRFADWLRKDPRSPLRSQSPAPVSVDQAASAQHDAGTDFHAKLIEIVSAVEQFEPWERVGFEADLKKIRELKRKLDSIGKGAVRRAFAEGSAVVQIERLSRYAVIRTIDILDGYRASPAPPPHDQSFEARWQVVGEPKIVLEHAADLFRLNADAAQKAPLQSADEIHTGGFLWEELQQYAAPALERYAGHHPPTAEVVMSTTVQTTTDIRSFHVDVPEDELAELRDRIAATRWPSKELVSDRSQGVQLATLQELARYWENKYDWRKAEAKLNALPQFTTEIDGVDVHFIHVKSGHENALPLIMTHGWPGSVIELLEVVGPLTDPTAYDGDAEDAFDLVLPSLPGYGFSGEPAEIGWDLGRTARAWAELMSRLGYNRYVAQGGDVGAGVTDAMGRQAPQGLVGIHTNLLVPALGGAMPTDTDEERAAAAQIATFQKSGNGYFVEMATRPQTIGYALLDSPVALAAWMVDHDTDAYYKIARAFVDGQPSGNLTRDHILDNITLYWLTGTGATAARSYWEAYGPDAPAASQKPLPPTAIPFGFTTFPGEIWRTPRSWVEASYPNVIYFNEVDRGGHFAAWEEPELFSSELRDAFRSLR